MHRPSLLRLRAALVLAFVAVLARLGVLPARGRRHPGLRRWCVGRRNAGRRIASPRLLPEHHPRPR